VAKGGKLEKVHAIPYLAWNLHRLYDRGLLPELWDANLFSYSSVFFSGIGALVGFVGWIQDELGFHSWTWLAPLSFPMYTTVGTASEWCIRRGDSRQAADCYRKVIDFIRQHPDDYDAGTLEQFAKLAEKLDPPVAT